MKPFWHASESACLECIVVNSNPIEPTRHIIKGKVKSYGSLASGWF